MLVKDNLSGSSIQRVDLKSLHGKSISLSKVDQILESMLSSWTNTQVRLLFSLLSSGTRESESTEFH